MTQREKLIEILSRYFTIGDSYEYSLLRVKSAFAIGTMSLEDFVEFDDEKVADIADYLLTNGVVVLPCRCKDCEWWKYNGADDALIPPTCYGDDGEHFCSYGERKGGDE